MQISLSAITTGGIFAVLFSEESTVAATIAAITATIQFFLNTFTKEYSLSDLVKRHADTASPTGKFTFHLFSALAEIERDLLRERTRAGLAAARARGRVGGKKKPSPLPR